MIDRCVIRAATLADVATLARHRAEMYRDMGTLPDDQYEPLLAASADYLAEVLASGEYLGWVATPSGSTEIVAGAGLLLRWGLPRLAKHDGVVRVAAGRQGIICNVFTERPWRRRGLARRLVEAAIDGARAAGVAKLVLNASSEGRPLYESLGFVESNEMRYTGPL